MSKPRNIPPRSEDENEHTGDLSSSYEYGDHGDSDDDDDLFYDDATDSPELYGVETLKRSNSLNNLDSFKYSEFSLLASKQNPIDETYDKLRTKFKAQRQRLSISFKREAELLRRRVGPRVGEAPKKAKLAFRKVVTGDKETRVRDHLKKRAKEPKSIRMVDKLSFTIGVINLATTEWFLLVRPEWFWAWFSFVIPSLVTIRHFMYKRLKFEYFLYDFCYYVQLCCMASIFLFPKTTWLWQANWAFANGPLMVAIVAWRNSLVFHSLDKITSVYIHAFPPLLLFATRWWPKGGDFSHICDDPNNCSLSYYHGIFIPMLIYCSWQVLYFVKVEIIDAAKLKADPSITTSLRWFAKDIKNPMYVGTLKACRAMGIMKRGEVFEASSLKTKIIFMVTQMIYTLITLLPSQLFFRHFYLHVIYIVTVFSWCVWQGANFYIEVFSRTYIKKFEAAMSQ